MKNARISVRLAKAAASQREAIARDVTAKAIDRVQWLWNIAGCRHELAGTTPADQLPMDADNEALNRLMAVSRLGGC